MAQMHPAAPAADAPSSEKQVFAALQDGLPQDWFVIHAQRLYLARHLAPQAKGFDVYNFHRLCHERCEQTGIPFDVPDTPKETQRFFTETAPELLLQALEADRYDALIVDEGQDFLELWWPAVESLLKDPKHSTLYVFYDPNQNLYGGSPTETLQLNTRLRLTHNCRNTSRIAEYSTALIDQQAVLHPDCPEGIAVEELHLTDPTQTSAITSSDHPGPEVDSCGNDGGSQSGS